ncbi:oligosaccharide flippase family protein [Paenibacillus humicola]|uniref:oligosaccharide flippase family protein n=1 Tax=Paenibacillus humicola TaxID=3110540 RepID=UPI00237B44D0|nr:oligosaccharide flippase family protein [Paenibacillus humicola]
MFVTKKIKLNRLTKNTFWMIYGNFSRVIMQGVYFVIVARSLGAENFGAFMGAVSLVAILAPFSGLGASNILIKNISRDKSRFQKYWCIAIIKTIISSVVLIILALILAECFLPKSVPLSLVLLVGLADIFFARILDVCSSAFQALQELKWTAHLSFLISISRLVFAVILYFSKDAITLYMWGWLYLLTIIICSSIAVFLVYIKWGRPIFNKNLLFSDLIEGFYFSISFSSQNIYNDLDKAMLTIYSGLSVSGIYSAAYRVIDFSFTPVRSLLNATYPKFFQYGTSGIKGSFNFAKRVIPFAVSYSLFTWVVLYALAPFIPYILGQDYKQSVEVVEWLAVLPLLKTMHYFAADTLTGAGYQAIRSGIQVAAAIFNVLINLWLINAFSLYGAIYSSIATDFLLMCSLWASLIYQLVRTRKQTGYNYSV